MSTNRLFKLAERFSRKISLGQAPKFYAQPSTVQKILKDAGLWEKSAEVAPLLGQAGVSSDASVSISIVVDNKLDIKYPVDTQPPAAAIKLAGLLRAKYAGPMRAAFQAANMEVSDVEPVTVGWLTF